MCFWDKKIFQELSFYNRYIEKPNTTEVKNIKKQVFL